MSVKVVQPVSIAHKLGSLLQMVFAIPVITVFREQQFLIPLMEQLEQNVKLVDIAKLALRKSKIAHQELTTLIPKPKTNLIAKLVNQDIIAPDQANPQSQEHVKKDITVQQVQLLLRKRPAHQVIIVKLDNLNQQFVQKVPITHTQPNHHALIVQLDFTVTQKVSLMRLKIVPKVTIVQKVVKLTPSVQLELT